MRTLMAIAFGVCVGQVQAADKTGIEVGQKAPDFKLKDQSGTERDLTTLLKDGPVALVFTRSASW